MASKKLCLIFISTVFLFVATQPCISFAQTDQVTTTTAPEQTSSSNTTPKEKAQAIREAAKEKVQNIRETAKERIQETKEIRKDQRVASRTAFMEKKALFNEEIAQKRELFIQNFREKQQEGEERLKTRREAFMQKLQTIKDERRQQIVENATNRLAEINTNRTTHLSQVLEKLSGILERLVNRSATANTNGKDTTTVDAAIAKAQQAITTAQTAVANQASKTYVPQIGSETTLKTTVGSSIQQLQTDLKTTRESVIAAKQAVHDVLQTIATVSDEKPATTSAVVQ